MKTATPLLALLLLSSTALAEVPRGVDKKWDSTLTVRVIKSGRDGKTIRMTATAPSSGELQVTTNIRIANNRTFSFKVPAGQTVSHTHRAPDKYNIVARFNGKVLDTESSDRKTGLGGSDMKLRGGGLGDKRKVGGR